MEPVVAEESFEVKAPPEKVWPFIADTDRMNRRLGLGGVKYTPIGDTEKGRTPARFIAETKLGGFTTKYEERPWEWTWTRGLSVRRDFQGSPIASLTVSWKMEAKGNGSLLHIRLEAMPRSVMIRPVVWWNLRANVNGFRTLTSEIEAHLASGAPSPFLSPKTAAQQDSLERCLAELATRGTKKPVLDRLRTLVSDAPDADCVKLRPFELADGWMEDRREVLVAFLNAVPAGLFEMRWSLVCPSCRTAAAEVPTLQDISTQGHCNQCDITFEAELDRAVEACFRPAAAVRSVGELMFCAAGPARTPHVLVQANLELGEPRTLLAPPLPGQYSLFARGGSRARLEVEASGPSEATLTLGKDGFAQPGVTLAPWGTLKVLNESGEPRHMKIERREYASGAVTAHYLTTVPEFRALFSKDLLKRGTPLKVSRVSLLFTDLTGSTALYSSVGDAAAFRFVDDHFDVLRGAVVAAGGTVVKTMGDAVMAAFIDDATCARAAFACLSAFDEFRRKTPHAEATALKLGVHGGPCYVVTANGTLDFFGQTVNVAARLQGLAESGEVVIQAEAWNQLPAAMRDALSVSAPFQARVKGVTEELTLVRVKSK
ncbi:MAG: adenylate/guanylate cyclase domain-containing protein [Archangium sp.]